MTDRENEASTTLAVIHTPSEAAPPAEIENEAENVPIESVTEAPPETLASAHEDVTASEVTAPPRRRRHLSVRLAGGLFSVIAAAVYVSCAVSALQRPHASPSYTLLSRIFPLGVIVDSDAYTLPPLARIPPRTVDGEASPGAAEEETLTEDTSEVPQSGRVSKIDLSVGEDNIFELVNETPYTPDTAALYTAPYVIPSLDELHAEYGSTAPIVLVLHTHGTEAYSDTSVQDGTYRTRDAHESVVALGGVISKRLAELGIGSVHLETMFDLESFNAAYSTAAVEIRRVLRENPSVRYVLDVHRDALIRENGDNLSPSSPVSGAAQMMLVVGTDHGGSGHDTWENNLSLALKLQKRLLARDSGIMRPINLRSASFNEQYTDGSLLIELGACGNTFEEARSAALILAEALADVIRQ